MILSWSQKTVENTRLTVPPFVVSRPVLEFCRPSALIELISKTIRKKSVHDATVARATTSVMLLLVPELRGKTTNSTGGPWRCEQKYVVHVPEGTFVHVHVL